MLDTCKAFFLYVDENNTSLTETKAGLTKCLLATYILIQIMRF